jgi:hypothetical protein
VLTVRPRRRRGRNGEHGGAIALIGYKHGELIDLEVYQRFYDDDIERRLQEGRP